MTELGTVVSTLEGPNTSSFSFVVSAGKSVRKNAFVQVYSEEGLVVGWVREIFRVNKYFERADSVSEYEKSGAFTEQFPAGEWEYVLANCGVLGVLDSGALKRCGFPPAPGARVLAADQQVVSTVAGFDGGVELGELLNHGIPVRVNLSRLLQKHLAILGMSGSGKSHAAAVVLEEVLSRKAGEGRLAAVVFDAHGDYLGFADASTAFGAHTKVVDCGDLRISTKHLTASFLREILPEITATGAREFSRTLQRLSKERGNAGLEVSEIVDAVEGDESLKENVRLPLLGWLEELSEISVFGRADNPDLREVIRPGKLAVFDLSGVNSLKKKQLLVSFVAKMLFALRRQQEIPPYLMLVEEAHNFAPEKASRENALSKNIIETVAREGRKFGACLCLVSQRPVQLSTTALSQCNSFLVMRVTNPYDVEHIAKSCEGIDRSAQNQITSLRTGEGILLGEAVNFPLFLRVRQRKSAKAGKSKSVEEQALEFEESASAKLDGDEKAFI
ncbi:MAG: ATP-binding protein [Candidatus Micrarchaeia archaeon]